MAELKANLAAFAKKGARVKLSDCGGRWRLKNNPSQSEAATKLDGPWTKPTGRSYVIPKGLKARYSLATPKMSTRHARANGVVVRQPHLLQMTRDSGSVTLCGRAMQLMFYR